MTQAEYLKTFVWSYKVSALWSSVDDTDKPLDHGRTPANIHPATQDRMEKDCAAFVVEHWEDLKYLDPDQCGHDFWLTRNGHGAGFWGRGLGEVGKRLSAACGWRTKYPEVNLYVGDDELIHA